MPLRIDRRIVKWGHGYGIRLSKDEVERKLRAKVGQRIRATFQPQENERNDLRSLVGFASKRPYATRKTLEEEFGLQA